MWLRVVYARSYWFETLPVAEQTIFGGGKMITFTCRCGTPLRAHDNQAGKRVICPNCRQTVMVPFDWGPQPYTDGPPPKDISPLIHVILTSTGSIIVLGILFAILFQNSLWLLFSLLGALIGGACLVRVFTVQAQAVRSGKGEVDIFFGLVKLILWQPNEGIILLKNKSITYVDENPMDGGGIKFLYPILGEEVALRVPLTIRPVVFTDDVLTRDYIELSARMSLWWQLRDLEKYYLLVSREVHSATDKGGHGVSHVSAGLNPELEAAERWLTLTTEAETRRLFSHASTGLLVANQITAQLPLTQTHAPSVLPGAEGAEPIKSDSALRATPPHVPSTQPSATDLLANDLHVTLNKKVSQYGLGIQRVELQEVRLPPELHAAAVDACKALFAPTKAEREASARQIMLQAEAGVLGQETVALREVLQNAPRMSFLGVPDFLQTLFAKIGQTRQSGSP